MELSFSRQRWKQIQHLFADVVGLEPAQRQARLDQVCGEDGELRSAVESLLDRHERGGPIGDYEDWVAGGLPPDPALTGDDQEVGGAEQPIGEQVGRYRLIRELGRGAMGVVYRAEDTSLGRPVALKFLSPALSTDQRARARLEREARAASALDHPNICTVYEIGETDEGRLYLALACYDGETLERRIERGPLEIDEAMHVAVAVARGLAAAHRHGIVHRDVKPSNVLLTDDGSVKLLDFGIARVADSNLTDSGDVLGTVAYMSPEQLRGEVDARADVWALGVVLHEMLMGTRPFGGDYEAAVLYAVLHETPAPIDRDDVPDELAEIVGCCLAKDPEERYPSVEEVEVALERLGLETASVPVRRVTRRTRRLAFGGGVLALLLLLFVSPLRTTATNWMGGVAIPEEKHIAVLPFENVGADLDSQTFADGLVETLVSKLTQMEQFQGKLWVVPSGEVRKNEISTASDAQQTLGVNLVVTGSVQRTSSHVRLTLNLLDAQTRRQLRAAVIDAPLADIITVQNGVVDELEEMLSLELNPDERRALASGGTTVSGAYDLYIQGLGYLQRYSKSENIDQAISLFEQSLKQDSSYALPYAALGEAYWLKYRTSNDTRWVDDAVANSEQALAINGRLAPVHVTLSRIYSGIGRADEALREARRALDIDPTNYASHFALALAHEARGEMDNAEAAYTKATELKPTYWEGYNELGRFYYKYGRYEEALTQFNRVIDLVPSSPWGYQNLGAVYISLERNAEAQSMLERAMAIRPNADAALSLGTLNYSEGRFVDAAQAYEQALRFNERDYLTWGNLGSAYRRIPSEHAKASIAFRRAILLAEELQQVNPKDPLLLSDMATYHAYLGEMNQALSLIEQALALDPQSVDVAVSATIVYEKLGDRTEALYWSSKAIKGGYPISMLNEPELDALRADPAFQDIHSER